MKAAPHNCADGLRVPERCQSYRWQGHRKPASADRCYLVGYQGVHLLAWRDLLLSARKGEPVFRQVFGVDRFTCLARHADAVEKFDRVGMAAWSAPRSQGQQGEFGSQAAASLTLAKLLDQ